MRKPWVRLYREEKGTFAMLPLFARALAKELLIIADDNGLIELGGRDAVDAIARQLGADTSDRRLLKKYIPMLIEDGYLVAKGSDLVIRKLVERQSNKKPTTHEPGTNNARVEHEPSTSDERAVHESATSDERTRNEISPNTTESLNSASRAFREEKIRGEERRGEKTRPPPQPQRRRRRDPLDYHRSHPVYLAALNAMSQARESAGWGPLLDSAPPIQQALGLACVAAEDLAEAKGLDVADVLAVAARGFVACRKPGARLDWWSEGFGDHWQAGQCAPQEAPALAALEAEQLALTERAQHAPPAEQAELQTKIRAIAAKRRELRGAA